MKYLFFSILCFLLGGFSAFAQLDTLSKEDLQRYEGEVIQLSEVLIFGKERTFDSQEAQRKYLILQSRVKKVYPYARLAAERLEIMEKAMDTMPRRMQKTYTKRMQRYIEQRFTDELKKLSRSQGRILVKLIHRQTGRTSFELVKELRNSWSAFWYNNTAWLYDISLKKPYNPWQDEEDFWIEDILQRAFYKGELQPQDPAYPIDYTELTKQWETKLR